ncbi:MAG: hypothetical protein ACYTFW_08375 [Planctomycetota bacterium]|jgi:hypothetical protein
MSIKSNNKRVGLCVMFVTSCIVLAAVWVVLATSKTALAAPPEGKDKGSGDTGTAPVCIVFEGGGIQSDDGPYCDDKQLKVKAIMTPDGHVNLLPNTGRGERTLYVDVDFNPDEPGIEIVSTDGWRFLVGGWNDSFDMRDMYPGEVRPDVNLMINMIAPPNEEDIVNWRLIFDPFYTMWGIDCSDSTCVTVTRGEDPDTDRWTIEIDNTNRAVLVLQKQVKNNSQFTYGGVVTVPPFTATVTLVP